MRCVIVMFDSLNRHHLAPYGCGYSHTPNFSRLAARSCRFDTSYVCSMPCMPARRDLHTGHPNFLHRSWGPLEPFDLSVFEVLQKHGVYSHLVTDHQHYWEDGGATYHYRYNSFDFIRGQEGDPWIARVGDALSLMPDSAISRNDWVRRNERYASQDLKNRQAWKDDDSRRPMTRTFDGGIDFIRQNHHADNWVLQLETFDPHEPFDAPSWARDLLARRMDAYRGPMFDWPIYDFASDQATPEQVEHLQHNYLALLAACDQQLGRVLRLFDELSLWDNTALVVCTDHGFFLGERDCMGKIWAPWWDIVARTPFFMHDPRVPSADGHSRTALIQPMLDLGPTLCELFGHDPAILLPDAHGQPLRAVLERDMPIRQAGLFGSFGHQVNVTDGRHVYMRAPRAGASKPPEYTLMPCELRRPFPPEKFAVEQGVRMAGPFDFTRGAQVMRIPDSVLLGGHGKGPHPDRLRTLLYDTIADPAQQSPIDDPARHAPMEAHLVRLMQECDAPVEQYERLGLQPPAA